MKRERLIQALLGILWAGLGLSFVIIWWFSGVPAEDIPRLLAEWLQATGTVPAVALFLVLYLLRPLVLFPSSVMGVASGLTFGPVLGCAVTIVGEIGGACVAFLVARLLGRRWLQKRKLPRLQRLDERVAKRGVTAVAILRLVWLPYDTVSYLCGLTRIRLADFAAGTLLGSIFYILSVTLLGGSASYGLTGTLTIGPWQVSPRTLTLVVAAVSFLTGVVLAWILRRRFADTAWIPGRTESA